MMHVSKQTGKVFDLKNTVYYDCHVTSLANILSSERYYGFLSVAAIPKIKYIFHGLFCKTILDSERQRDEILFNHFGIQKTTLDYTENIENIIKSTILKYGHCVARVDSFYHEYFKEFFLKEHRTNGHKITIVDWDDEYFYGIDNVGYGVKLLKFKINDFLESIYSNIIHVYDKEDTLYYLEESDELIDEELIDREIKFFINDKKESYLEYEKYLFEFENNINTENKIRKYAQIHNSYSTSLQIENSYKAIIEAYKNSKIVKRIWKENLQDADTIMQLIEKSMNGFSTLKMQCKVYETSKSIGIAALKSTIKNLIDIEKDISKQIKG